MKKLFFTILITLICIWQAKAQDAASVIWPLLSTNGTEASVSGQLDSPDFQISGLSIKDYGGTGGTIRFTKTTTWQTDEDPSLYVEFSIAPKAGATLTASKISFEVCGSGGGNMRANFYYSTDPSFVNKTQINYKVGEDLERDNQNGYALVSTDINESLGNGEKLYFRIYPYYKSASTGKHLCLKNLTIEGTTEATAIAATATWPFENNLSPVISGALLVPDMSFGNGIELYDYATSVPTLDGVSMPGGSAGPPRSTSCAWTASETPLDDIYFQYQVSPKAGATLTITDISMLISAFSTNSMKAAVYYSKNADFSDKVTLQESTAIASGDLSKWNFTLNETVNTGETFYLRVYPHLTINGTWKLVNVRNVVIAGSMIGATADPAEVSTVASASYISTTTALAGGTVSNDGGAPVTARGMVWATTPSPTVDDSKSEDGDGAGVFESTINGLAPGTQYYARAYATNKAGTAYGNEITFTTLATLAIPTVTTTGTSNTRNTSMIVSGRVTEWGGSDVTERGIVWGTAPNPTIETNKIASGNDLGTYQSYIDGLTPQTKYYVRAYATNSTGTAYGNEMEVTTRATDPDVTKVIAQNGTGDYLTVQEAFDAVPSDYTGKWMIKIKPGTYNERPSLAKGKVNVYLIGEDPLTTIITHNTSAGTAKPGGGTWGTSGSQTMEILADDFTAVNITVENTFINSREQAAINSGTQAVALKTQGDRQSFYDCRITGYQDTYLGNSIGRAYFKNCYIEGNVDFIFGRQTVVFDECITYVNRNGSVLTAPSTEKTTKFGMVFLDCDLTAPSTSYIDFNGDTFKEFHYGRPWQNEPKSAFIRCNVPATLNEKGWTTMNGGLNPVFVEYGCIGEGATNDKLTKRSNEGIVITEAEASIYTVSNIFKKETDPSFAADWMPSPTPNIPTSIEENVVNNSSTEVFSYPNPFSSSFTINYTLGRASNVIIKLYDINGTLIGSLNSENQPEGSHSVEYNGSNLAAGVYFYSVNSNSGNTTQKIIKK